MTYALHLGDSRDVLKTLPDASVDSVVCDPPYELGFMGKGWDAAGIAYDVSLWREVLRVLKPGGHLLAFGGTRTYHRMACAIEDAGFEIRDSLHWLYGSGFPKSLNVSKAIDKAAGAEREVVGARLRPDGTQRDARLGGKSGATLAGSVDGTLNTNGAMALVTAPATDAAKEWDGWGTALKPAHEPVVVARKPLVGNVVKNVLTHGTGALNIDGTRVGGDTGRWPPNVVLAHTPECGEACAEDCAVAELDRQSGIGRSGTRPARRSGMGFHGGNGTDSGVREVLDGGGASRFFPVFKYQAKASRSERNAGCDSLPKRTPAEMTGRKEGAAGLVMEGGKANPYAGTTGGEFRSNHHPTVKPVALMEWLVRLVTPPQGVVLDPFTGSGTTGVAALRQGFRFIGIEREPEYHAIAAARIQAAASNETQLELLA